MIPRLATPGDAPELVRVINLAYQVEAEMFHGERTSADDVRERMAAPNAVFLAIDDPDTDGRLVGAVYVESNDRRGYFGMLSVDPACQGCGLGKALVHGAEDYCRSLGCDVMDIDVVHLRTELPGFYASLGYTQTGTTPYSDPSKTKQPVVLLQMEKPLV